MALYRWSTPHTWTSGETVTSSLLNVDLRDNVRYLRNRNTAGAVTTGLYRSGQAVSVANQCHFMRVMGSGVISRVRIRVEVQSGILACAVYDSTGTGMAARPSTRVAWTGPFACPSVGDAEIALETTVDVGEDHWLAVVATDATASLAKTSNWASGREGWAMFAGWLHYQTSAWPPPASASVTGAGGAASFLIVGLP